METEGRPAGPSPSLASRCEQCGADQPHGASCEECFHALLAFEAERPEAFGAVHHITVSCYSLQHPRGYTRAALNAWRALIADALDGRASIAQFRARAGEDFRGAVRIREPGESPPAWWPRDWPLHVRDLIRPNELPSLDAYVARAREWAGAIRSVLDASEQSQP